MTCVKLQSIRNLEENLAIAQLQIKEYRTALEICSKQLASLGQPTNVADTALLQIFDETSLDSYSKEKVEKFMKVWSNSAANQGIIDSTFETGVIKKQVSDEMRRMIGDTLDWLDKYVMKYENGELQ